MSTRNSPTSNDDERIEGNDTGGTGRVASVVSAASQYASKGPLAMLAGGILVARAIRSDGRGRSLLQGLAGIGLLAYGLRERTASGPARSSSRDESEVSADAYAARYDQGDREPGATTTNPDGEGAVAADEGYTESDEDDVEFTEDPEDASPSPHLEGENEDPRLDEDDEDETVEVDVSERAMADEASEAVGPDPTQAQPAQTDDTEPEQSPPEDASHMQADEPGGSSDSGTDEASVEDADAEDADDADAEESGFEFDESEDESEAEEAEAEEAEESD